MNLETVKGAIERYLRQGIKPGSCLEAILRSDLFEAFGRADEETRAEMFNIVSYVYNECPTGATRGNVDRWLGDGDYRREVMRERDNMQRAMPK